MKIRVEQLNPIVGDLEYNASLISNAYQQAVKDEMDLCVFPELVTCGYPPMDLLERPMFVEALLKMNDELIGQTSSTWMIFGTVSKNHSGKGRKLYNTAYVAQQGEVKAMVHKTLLPTYDVFDEFRYFEPNTCFEPVDIKGVKFGLTICEDLWYNENSYQYHIYDVNPAQELALKGIGALINVSASPFTKYKSEQRFSMLQGYAQRLGLPLVYSNQVGANTELIFDGDSMIIDNEGEEIARTVLFESASIDAELSPTLNGKWKVQSKATPVPSMGQEERIFKALVHGVRDYVTKTAFTEKAILGLSGGIDSALTAVVATEALGKENVLGITMPSEFSSNHSISDSEQLARNLGIRFEELPIKSMYDGALNTLDPLFSATSFNVAEENIQSRLRGLLLMAVSNKFGYILLNTGNKSEMAVGYCTLYGDMAGGLSVLSDVYKTEVFAISKWLNTSYYQREVIPESTITKPPSAELRPDQKDTDSLPEYEVLDRILKRYIEDQWSLKELLAAAHDRNVVEKIIQLVDFNEYKRRQAPPGLRISDKAFGVGRRLPLVQRWTQTQLSPLS